jgi:hypothetical protein
MAVDLSQALRAAVLAALQEPAQNNGGGRGRRKPRLSAGRAFLLGAGLMTAGRLLVGHRGHDLLVRLQDQLAEPDDQAEDEEGHGDEELDDEDELGEDDEDYRDDEFEDEED